MQQHWHPVAVESIKSKYYKSLGCLKAAIQASDRAYLYDNSGASAILIAEIESGINVTVYQPDQTPNWFINYVYEA